MNGLADQSQLKGVLLYSLRGRSSDRAQHFMPQAINEAVDLEAFITSLGGGFMPESEALVARLEFSSRKQHPDEDSGSYYTIKRYLYTDAYPSNEDFSVFFKALINGLASPVIKRLLRRAAPTGFEEARQTLLQITAAERSMVLSGYGEQVDLVGLKTVVSQTMGYEGQQFSNNGPFPWRLIPFALRISSGRTKEGSVLAKGAVLRPHLRLGAASGVAKLGIQRPSVESAYQKGEVRRLAGVPTGGLAGRGSSPSKVIISRESPQWME